MYFSDTIKKILVIHYGAIGDFISGTIALKALRDTFSDACITLLSRQNTYEITPPGSIIDEYIFLDTSSIKKIWQLLLYVRSCDFDIVINLKEHSEFMHLIVLFSKSKKKVGFGKGLWRYLYDYYPLYKIDLNQHEYIKKLSVVETVGAKNEKMEAFVNILEKDIEKAEEFLKNNCLEINNFLVIAPGASDLRKAWRIEKFIDLCKKFVDTYNAKIVVTWGSEFEKELSQSILNNVKSNVFVFPRSNIGTMAALIRRAALCVCNNSGMMHVAYAVETPVICINTSISWQAFGEKNYNVNAFGENIKKNKYLPNDKVRELLDTISVEQVWEVLQTAWLQVRNAKL